MSAIKLAGDLSSSQRLNINRELELDLGGHTLTNTIAHSKTSGYVINVDEGGKLTLKNGAITAQTRLGLAKNGGQIVIDSGTYTSVRNVAFTAIDGGKVTFNDGTIYSQEGGITAPGNGGIIEVNGGLIETADNFAISTNGNAGNDHNVITINGGRMVGNITSTGYEAIGIYVANNDTLTVNGGEIVANGGTGICMRGGTVVINDGTITALKNNKAGQPVPDGKIGDDATIAEGVSAIVYHKSSDYQNAGMNLTINGGTIIGVDKSIDVIGDENPSITINGGTLTPAYSAA